MYRNDFLSVHALLYPNIVNSRYKTTALVHKDIAIKINLLLLRILKGIVLFQLPQRTFFLITDIQKIMFLEILHKKDIRTINPDLRCSPTPYRDFVKDVGLIAQVLTQRMAVQTGLELHCSNMP